jgi:tRNA-intron endonuclease, archaea type
MTTSGRSPETLRSAPTEPLPTSRRLEDGSSRVEDPTSASQLHGRGSYGTPESGGSLLLDPLETIYLAEQQRLSVVAEGGASLSFPALLAAEHARDPTFEIRYLVYRDLRQRGYVVLRGPAPAEFSLLPRGGTPARTPSKWWIEARSERTRFPLALVADDLARVRGARKTLLIGVVDEESDLTYYRAREVVPHGESRPPEAPPRAEGSVLEDRVSVFDPESARTLDSGEHYGYRIGDRLELSLLEALYLSRQGRLALHPAGAGGPLSPEAFERDALRSEPDLLARLPVYQHLRELGLIPKTGFKYGAHFRAYEKDPESSHARYLVHVVPAGWSAPWPEVARAIRLAQGVRKQFLLGYVPPEGGEPRYVHLERVRP